MFRYVLFLLVCCPFWCAASDSLPVRPPFEYQLDRPARVMILEQASLGEISGLSPAPTPGQICAIADEAGEVYFLDAQTGQLLNKIVFRLSGDFEGIEWTGRCMYAVKSDGDIFELDQLDGQTTSYVVHKTPLKKSQDIEGLGHAPSLQALLLVTKGKPSSPDLRHVYAFDLSTKTLRQEPLFVLDPTRIEAERKKKGKEKVKEGKAQEYFSPSGIAVHPVTGHYYILSSAVRRLVVLDPVTGQVVEADKLDKEDFPQPEGICFDPDGTLYIASEGKGGNGRILVFHPQ
jgi:uncharacterized protein YjiK